MQSNKDKPAPATTSPSAAPAIVPWVPWIPFPTDGSLAPPPGLNYYQIGWWWNLFLFALKTPPQGYLNVSPDRLWVIAGSHRSRFWDANCREVMAHWEPREVEGRTLLCLPALVALVEEAQKKIRQKKTRKGEDFSSTISTASKDVSAFCLSPSDFESAFESDFESQKQQQQQSTARAPAPEACARRMIGVLSLTSTDALTAVIAAAITAEADYSGQSLQEAAQAICDYAMQARAQGVAIDRWFFEDTKWRNKRKSKSEVATDEFAERIERERDILRRAGGS